MVEKTKECAIIGGTWQKLILN